MSDLTSSQAMAHKVAPCGMNCAVCYVHLRPKKPCPGCRADGSGKPAHCRQCAVADCAVARGVSLCAQCSDFPCVRLKRMEKSYTTRYGVSLLEMGRRCLEVGEETFLKEEARRWTCPQCGRLFSLHDRRCLRCVL